MELSKGYRFDAGNDIILEESVEFLPHKMTIVNLGKLPRPLGEGVCAIIAPRSSAAAEGLLIANCPIDTDYCGDVHAMVYNTSDKPVYYPERSAFCQLVIYNIRYDDSVKERKLGRRSDGAFGSTNK